MADTPTQHISQSLWDRVTNFFDGMWGRFFQTPDSITNPLFANLAAHFTENIDAYVVTHLITALEKQLADLDIPDDVKDTINDVLKGRDSSNLLLAYLFIAVYYATTLSAHASIAGLKSTQKWNQSYMPTIPDVNTLIINLFRNPDLELDIKEFLGKHGYDDKSIKLLLDGNKTILNPDQIKTLFLRKEIDEEKHDKLLGNFGYTPGVIAQLKELYYPIPSYPDLINMAVREAFQPEYIKEFDLLKEFPGEFKEWAAKQGLSDEWQKRFWASHWALPSILQGFEMLHRGVINASELDSLFMATDIMPWWRDKLKAISYNPLTRVDVRRVFKMGIIKKEEVLRTYLDLGYDQQKATWLTNFTEMETVEKERDLTKAEILSSYGKKVIDQETCTAMLGQLGYSENEVNILVTSKNYDLYKKTKDLTIKRIQKMYLAGVYSATEAVSELGRLDLAGAEQTALVNQWNSERLAKLRNLTKKEYDGLFQARIISESDYQTEMSNLGYKPKHINWCLTLLKQAPAEG